MYKRSIKWDSTNHESMEEYSKKATNQTNSKKWTAHQEHTIQRDHHSNLKNAGVHRQATAYQFREFIALKPVLQDGQGKKVNPMVHGGGKEKGVEVGGLVLEYCVSKTTLLEELCKSPWPSKFKRGGGKVIKKRYTYCLHKFYKVENLQ